MKVLIFLVFIFIYLPDANSQDKLYYFKSKESGLIGVKDDKGKIIVKPIFQNLLNVIHIDKPILTKTIEFYFLPEVQKADFSKPVTAFGAVYNRKGEFLYNPLFFDNGPDYWNNGVRRFVENGKIGFVNEKGEKVIAAKYDFATPFDDGYALVSLGNLKKNYFAGGENWSIAGDTLSYYINLNGERVIPTVSKD